jgi:hypothetical protein
MQIQVPNIERLLKENKYVLHVFRSGRGLRIAKFEPRDSLSSSSTEVFYGESPKSSEGALSALEFDITQGGKFYNKACHSRSLPFGLKESFSNFDEYILNYGVMNAYSKENNLVVVLTNNKYEERLSRSGIAVTLSQAIENALNSTPIIQTDQPFLIHRDY